MNDICKQSTMERLSHKIEVEKLKTSEIGRGLGISPNYISMILNEKHWKKCPKSAWERVLNFINSGYTLSQYAEKCPAHKPEEVKEDSKPEHPIVRVKPEALEARKKELAEREKPTEVKTVLVPRPIELNIPPEVAEKIKEADRQMDEILKERKPKVTHPLAVEAIQPKQEFTDTARLKIALDIEINLVVNGHKVSMI